METKFISVFLFFSVVFFACSSNQTEKFLGTWTGDISCEGESDSFSMIVTLGASDDAVLIQIEDTPILNATIDGDDLILEPASISDGGGDSTELSGSGSLNDNGELIMTFDIEVIENGQVESSGTCIAILSQ